MADTNDPALKDEDDFSDLEERQKSAEQAILQAPAVIANLNDLEQAGADKAKILRLLAIFANLEDRTLIDLMRKRARRLLQLSQDLERLATQVEKNFSDPLTFSAVWAALLLPTRDHFADVDGLERFPNPAVAQMRKLSKALYWEDRKLRRLANNYPNLMSNWFLSAIVHVVKEATGSFHDEELSNLLQAAHQALGSNKEFSGESLRKFRQRHARSLIRARTPAKDITISEMLRGLY